jgi:hypothetical protein
VLGELGRVKHLEFRADQADVDGERVEGFGTRLQDAGVLAMCPAVSGMRSATTRAGARSSIRAW